MVCDKEPEAFISPSHDGQRPLLERVQDRQRDQLLWKLIRTVVITATRGDRRQRVGLVICAH